MMPSGVDTLDLMCQSTTTLVMVTVSGRETHLTMMLVTAESACYFM